MCRQKQASTSSLSCLRSYRKRRKGRTIINHAPSSLSCLRFYLKRRKGRTIINHAPSSLSCLRFYLKRRKGRTIINHAPSSLSCLRFYLKCHKKGKRHTSCPSILNSQSSLQMIRLMLHNLHRPIQLLRQNQARHLMRERHLRQFQTKIRPLSEIVSVSERPAD